MRLRNLAVVVVLLLVAAGCSSQSTTAPSTAVMPPLTSDLEVSGVSATPQDGIVTATQPWAVSFSFRCRPGTVFGVVFQKENGATMPGNRADNCASGDEARVSGTEFRNTADPSLVRFAEGGEVSMQFATANDISTWSARGYTLQPGLGFKIKPQ